MKHNWLILVLFLSIISSPFLFFGADIGSDTAVTRFDATQLIADGDRIAGFAWLTAGFLVEGALAEWTFDSVFPIAGALNFNFSTVNLNQDLILTNVSEISRWGNINGDSHIFEISQSARCLPTESESAACSITFTFDDIKAASVNAVSFSFDNLYLATGEGNDLSVDQVINENFLQDEATDALGNVVNGVAWHPSNDWIAATRASGSGDEIYTYTFDRSSSTLTLIDSINLGGGGGNGANGVAWNPDGDRLAVATDVNAGEVRVYVINTDGTFGAVVTDNISQDANAVDWDKTGDFIVFGCDGGGGFDELRVYEFTKGAPDTLVLNASSDTAQTLAVTWNKGADSDGELAIGKSSGTDRFQVFRHNSTAGTLTFLDGSSGTQVNAVAWHPDGGCIVAGLQNNSEGTGGELRVFSFVDDEVTLEDDNEVDDDVLSLDWSPDGRLLAVGSSGGGSADPLVSLYRFDADFISTSAVTFDNVHMIFNANATFNAPAIVFTGESSINGREHVISFSPTFSIQIDSNASILIENATLRGLEGRNLAFVDSTSTVSLQNVTIMLDEEYTMDAGHFEIMQDVRFSGEGTFIYQSPETSIITSASPEEPSGQIKCNPGECGHLFFENGATFSYDVTSSSTLINLEGDLARFILNSGNLAVTDSLELTKGHFIVDGRSTISAGTSVTFGDGTLSNNLQINIHPAANLEITGNLIYNNI